MTPAQSKRFNKLCKDMAALLKEVRQTQPDATLFIEDGCVSLYDWPDELDDRPAESISDTHFWPGASGGGAGND